MVSWHPANDSQLTTQIISILMVHKGHIFKLRLQLVQNWRSLWEISGNPQPGSGAHPDQDLDDHDLDEEEPTQTSSNIVHFRIIQKGLFQGTWNGRLIKPGKLVGLIPTGVPTFLEHLQQAEQQGWSTLWNHPLNKSQGVREYSWPQTLKPWGKLWQGEVWQTKSHNWIRGWAPKS